jgi:GDP/UDP-N,N'-diacetylbacillosamine 2-epimerase (hydrolysing)
MKIAFLTSSRADFGIYLPLLRAMRKDSFFDLHIIAFGTHLSPFHGNTIDSIISDGFAINHRIENIMASDTAESIATSMSITIMKLGSIWQVEQHNYDLVFCLGDRYEMFAAVSASVPFNIKVAHIHGGETTLGAIDNKFRHCISILASIHFVSTEQYAEKVAQLTGRISNIHVVGALSLDNLDDLTLLSKDQFLEQYQIDIGKPTILATYHPETITPEKNEQYAQEAVKALSTFKDYQVIITMPNADTTGNIMRKVYKQFAQTNPRVFLVENFGTLGYFSCMKYSKIIVGNSSSGIIEAASFQKYVVDIGNRQEGRITSGNIFHSSTDAVSIKEACDKALTAGEFKGRNVYLKNGASAAIVNILKNAGIAGL